MSTIYLRRAKLADLDTIMEIIEEARNSLKNDGNPQWQDGHPDRAMIAHDISQEISWGLVVNDQVAGTAALQLAPEPSYQNIHNGQWSHPQSPYATIPLFHGSHSSTSGYPCTNRPINTPTAENRRIAPKIG